jgi:predicted nucleic acid-binding protein
VLHVLDTTVLIDFLRGRPAVLRVLDLLEQGVTPATTAVNVEEIVRGLRGHEEPAAGRLFAGLVGLPVTPEAGQLAGRWRREHGARGVTLSQADCLIAATCVRAGAALVTGNPKDFPMPELAVIHWPVGE